MRFSGCALLTTITISLHRSYVHGFQPALCGGILLRDVRDHSSISSERTHLESNLSSPCSIRLLPWQLFSSNPGGGEEEEDLLDYFDPLRSPHDYPEGIDSKKKKTSSSNPPLTNTDDEWTPLQMKNVKDDFRGASEQDYRTQKTIFTGDWASSPNIPDATIEDTEQTNSADDDFDPLLSPHAYPNGTSSKPVLPKSTSAPTPKQKTGVLLIDHGSKRPSSNEHLLKVASLYQSRAPPNIVVRAAHMEIVPPFIRDGIEALWKEDGVDRIVCHPYFLSPGRHVTEDVPELIYGAVVGLNGESVGEGVVWDGVERLWLGEGEGEGVEVVMTEPVGSNIERMVDIVGDMVGDSVGEDVMKQVVGTGGKEQMGGFFGNVQRMMDEQL